MVEARVEFIHGPPEPNALLSWLLRLPAGAVHVVVTRAKPPGLEATSKLSQAALETKCRSATHGVPLQGYAVAQGWGPIPAGQPLLVIGAAADHRAEAFEAVDRLLAAMKGVTERRDAQVLS